MACICSHYDTCFKVAEHSFSVRFCWCNLARAQGFQKNKHGVNRAIIYLLNTRTICVIFLYNCMQCVDGFSILLQWYVAKGNDAKNPAFLAFVCYWKNQLNAMHAQLLEKLRSIALAETHRFLAIQLIEFQEIWQKNRSETTWMIYDEKSEFWHREFLIIQETINGELRKSPMSKFYWTVLTKGI